MKNNWTWKPFIILLMILSFGGSAEARDSEKHGYRPLTMRDNPARFEQGSGINIFENTADTDDYPGRAFDRDFRNDRARSNVLNNFPDEAGFRGRGSFPNPASVVPEPSSTILFISGMAALIGFRKRPRKQP